MLEFRFDTQLLIEGHGLDEDAIRHACAAGAAATEMPGAASPSLTRVDALADEVVVTRFEGNLTFET